MLPADGPLLEMPAEPSTPASVLVWLGPSVQAPAAGLVDEDDEPSPPGPAMCDIPGNVAPASDAAKEAPH